MAEGKDRLEGYVDVAERIAKFHERYPDGSLQGSYVLKEIADQLMLIYRAEAFRTPDDPRPGIGYAWEPIPGLTPFTRGSELMVGETSAWGRALAALGFEVHRGIASAQEVANRESDDRPAQTGFASEKQRDFLDSLLAKNTEGVDVSSVIPWAEATQSGARDGGISKLIDALKTGDQAVVARAIDAADSWAREQSDLPAPDTADLPEVHDEQETIL